MMDDDLNALISELNESGGAARNSDNVVPLESMLAEVVQRRGSDLLLVAGSPPAIRVDGAVERTAGGVLDGLDIEEIVMPAASTAGPEAVRRERRLRRVAPAAPAGPVPHQPAPRARPDRGGDTRPAVAGAAAL